SPSLIGARLQLAQILSNQGRFSAALAEYDGIRVAIATEPVMRERLDRNLDYAYALGSAGRADQAVAVARAAFAFAPQRFGDGHPETAIARRVLARALTAGGQAAAALVQV